jgi:hypothetical protein
LGLSEDLPTRNTDENPRQHRTDERRPLPQGCQQEQERCGRKENKQAVTKPLVTSQVSAFGSSPVKAGLLRSSSTSPEIFMSLGASLKVLGVSSEIFVFLGVSPEVFVFLGASPEVLPLSDT